MKRIHLILMLPMCAVALVTPATLLAQGSEAPPTVMRSWSESDVPGMVFEPLGVATDRWGNVYVADDVEHCIWKFDANGA